MKNMIADAFMNLCLKKNIDKITVKDIVETCGISRQTFYYHFQDVLDVVEWGIEQSVQRALDLSLQKETLEEVIEVFFTMAIKHREIIEKMLKSQRRDRLEIVFVRGVEQYLKGLLQKQAVNVPISVEDMELIKCFYTFGTVGVLLDYCGRRDVDVKRLSGQIARLLRKMRSGADADG